MEKDEDSEKDTKTDLPEEGSVSREDFLMPKSTTEVVILYIFRIILGIAFLIGAVNAYHMAGTIGVVVFILLIIGSVYAFLLGVAITHKDD